MFHPKAIVAVLIFLGVLSKLAWPEEAARQGNEAFERADYINAIDYYSRALASEPSFALYVNLGHSYTRLERWSDAAAAYEAATKLDGESVTAQIWRFLGQARYNSGEFRRAIEAFVRAESVKPDNKDNVWIARSMIELEQWIQAQSVLSLCLRQNPDDTETLELLAYVTGRQGNWPGVIDIYRQLLSAAPADMEYRIDLANALAADGRSKQAIDALEFARRVDPSLAERINRLLADLYLAENMPHEAAGCYASLVSIREPPPAEDCFRLGAAYLQTRELTSAENALRKMRQADPADFRADLYLGHVAAERNDFENAKLSYKAAIKKNPSSPEGYLALASLQMKNRRHSDAAANFSRAIELGDNRPQVHYNHILALIDRPDGEQVKQALKKAIAEHPADKSILGLLDKYVEQTATDRVDQ